MDLLTSLMESSLGSIEHTHVMQAWRKDETFAISGESAHNFDKEVACGMQFDFIKCFIRICRKEGPSRVISLLAMKRKKALRTYHITTNT